MSAPMSDAQLVFILPEPRPCVGCERTLRREAAGVIVNLPTRRMRPVCERCSLRARESGIFHEQLTQVVGLGFTIPRLRRRLSITRRDLPTTVAGWDALIAAEFGGVR
jgi:hypothetical protein